MPKPKPLLRPFGVFWRNRQPERFDFMNFNLLPLLRDMGNVLRLRYHPIEHYRYGLPVFLVVILGVGVANAVMLRPMFGYSDGILAFAIVFGVLKWLLLTRATTGILHYFGSPRIPFLGYALMTEALILPILLLPYFPELTLFFSIWQMWIFWVQLLGFALISQQAIWRVLVAYVVYGLLLFVFALIFLFLFHTAGWLDLKEMNEHLQQFMQQPKPKL